MSGIAVGVLIVSLIAVIAASTVPIALLLNASKNTSDNGKNSPVYPCSQVVNKAQLLNIPLDYPACVINNKTTYYYYLGKLNPKYDFVVAPFPTSIQGVCIGFCESFINGTCKGSSYAGRSAQDNYNQCLKDLQPTENCLPPEPIAVRDGILYYAFSPTVKICLVTEENT